MKKDNMWYVWLPTQVILMSATLQSDLFAQYFALPFMNRLEPAPVLTVEGKLFSVSEYYAGQLKKLGPVRYMYNNLLLDSTYFCTSSFKTKNYADHYC